jgi:hypothetical protein
MQEGHVAVIDLSVRRGSDGKPVWIADGRHEALSASSALAAAGAQIDTALATVPGFGWGD